MLVLDGNGIESSIVGRWLDNVVLNCLGLESITSVLSELRSRMLLVIHAFTSLRQASILGRCTIYQVSWIGKVGCHQHSNGAGCC